MESTLPATIIIWLVAANFLLMVFIIIDRFRLMHKKASDLEDQFVREALKNLHDQIQKTNKDLSDNTLQFQEHAQNQTLELLAAIRSTIFSRYETEFKLIDDSVKKNIQTIDGEVNQVVQDIRTYVEKNNTQISTKYNAISKELEDGVNTIIQDSQEKMHKALESNDQHTQEYMKSQIDQKVNRVVTEILHNKISLKDHEQLIEQAIQEYIKSRS